MKRLDLKGALRVTKTFILVELGGEYGTITPLNASYDEEEENWEITCEFKRRVKDKLEKVALWIDDESEEVISFEISE